MNTKQGTNNKRRKNSVGHRSRTPLPLAMKRCHSPLLPPEPPTCLVRYLSSTLLSQRRTRTRTCQMLKVVLHSCFLGTCSWVQGLRKNGTQLTTWRVEIFAVIRFRYSTIHLRQFHGQHAQRMDRSTTPDVIATPRFRGHTDTRRPIKLE